MRWSKRIGGCLFSLFGAALCACVLVMSGEQLIKQRPSFHIHGTSAFDWVVALVIFPGIALTLLMFVAGVVMCLRLSVRCLSGKDKLG
jgi:hypothetical protein